MSLSYINYGQNTTGLDINRIEQKHHAKYMGDFCLKTTSGEWSTEPAAIFWQETPPVEGYSNYFGIIRQRGVLFITSGASAFKEPIRAAVAKNGEIIYSRWRHDYRGSTDGSVHVDGGRDYYKCSFQSDKYIPASVLLVPEGPTLKVMEEVSSTQ